MAFFNLKLHTETTLLVDGEPNDCVTEYYGEVICIDERDGEDVVAGHVRAMRVQAGMAFERGESLFDVCDAHSDGLHAIHSLFYKPGKDELKERFAEKYHAFEADMLVLDYIILDPKWRGLKLGLLVARKMIDLLAGGCGLVVSEIAPLRRAAHKNLGVPAKWLPKPTTREGWTAALTAVRKYFRQVGFSRMGRSPYYFLSTAMEAPTASELLKPQATDE